MSTLRERIRAVTDALPKGRWLIASAIHNALPEPKPPLVTLQKELLRMTRAEFLKRRGSRRLHEYRSGRVPYIDLRTLYKGKPKPHASQHLGCAALRRLMESDPAAFKRLTKHDGPGWRSGL